MSRPNPVTAFSEEIRAMMADAAAEDEQAHWEDDPEYRAIYCPPSDLDTGPRGPYDDAPYSED